MSYLTKELKNYYMKDFNNNVLNCKDEYWAIEKELIDTLNHINKNQNIQTLYSKKCIRINNYEPPHSYIMLAVTKEFEPILKEAYKRFKTKDVDFSTIPPNIIDTFEESHPLAKDMGCVSNPEYFNINVFYFELYSISLSQHKYFWKEIKRNLVIPN